MSEANSTSTHSLAPHPTSIRSMNRASIISLIRRRPGLTRSELSQLSGLSKGTVSSLIAELLTGGVLYEDDAHGARQRNTRLWLNRKAGVAVGIELSADECRAVLTDMQINPLKHAQRSMISTRVEDTLDTLATLTRDLLAGVEEPCVGVAVAVPAPIDAQGESVIFAESLGWTDVPLAARLAERLPSPIKLANRPRAGVLGEHWYGAGVGIKDLIYVSISSGVAAGILIDGRLFGGSYGYGGELGHTTMLLDGPPCVCGNHGCLEAVASLPAITRAVEERVRSGEPSVLGDRLKNTGRLSAQCIIDAARDGDSVVLEETRSASRYIGVAVANLIDMFNPACVIIGGRLAEVGEVVVSTVRETAQRRAFPLSFSNVQIVRSALGADSVGVGACALVVDQYIAQVEPALQERLNYAGRSGRR